MPLMMGFLVDSAEELCLNDRDLRNFRHICRSQCSMVWRGFVAGRVAGAGWGSEGEEVGREAGGNFRHGL